MRYGVPARSTSRGAKGCRSSMITSVCERVRRTALTFQYHAEKLCVRSVFLPCLASMSARRHNPLSEALSPCQDATGKMALSYFDLITLNRHRSSSCVRQEMGHVSSHLTHTAVLVCTMAMVL